MILTMLYGGIVGIALGLTGGGGSIFAVPLLLYAIGLPLREAVTVSLGVVGLTALYGAGFQWSLVSWLPGIIFGIASSGLNKFVGHLPVTGTGVSGGYTTSGRTLIVISSLPRRSENTIEASTNLISF
jgi:uncharacterized membrane protein YfcA